MDGWMYGWMYGWMDVWMTAPEVTRVADVLLVQLHFLAPF